MEGHCQFRAISEAGAASGTIDSVGAKCRISGSAWYPGSKKPSIVPSSSSATTPGYHLTITGIFASVEQAVYLSDIGQT